MRIKARTASRLCSWREFLRLKLKQVQKALFMTVTYTVYRSVDEEEEEEGEDGRLVIYSDRQH